MKGKFAAKRHSRLAAALALTMLLISPGVTADDGNLTQALAFQQHKSRFQLMLEQVQAQARQRAAAAHTSAAAPSPGKISLGDETETLRLTPVPVVGRELPDVEPVPVRRLRTRQAYERDQRRILDHRQQSRALTAGLRTAGPVGSDRYATRRNELVRFNTQNKRLSLQRKLRY